MALEQRKPSTEATMIRRILTRLALTCTVLLFGLPAVAEAQDYYCYWCDFETAQCQNYAIRGYDTCTEKYLADGSVSCKLEGEPCSYGSLAQIAPDGSLLALGGELVRSIANTNGGDGVIAGGVASVSAFGSDRHLRRGCNGAVVARFYSEAAATALRRNTAILKI